MTSEATIVGEFWDKGGKRHVVTFVVRNVTSIHEGPDGMCSVRLVDGNSSLVRIVWAPSGESFYLPSVEDEEEGEEE